MKHSDVQREIQRLTENLQTGADRNIDDGGYEIGNADEYEKFVALRRYHLSNTENPIDFPKIETKMNERIEKLFGQALDEAVPETWTTLNPAQLSRLKEKFAELILQDIDRIVDELYRAMPLEQAAVLLTLDETIKEHFYGVEE